MFNRIKILNLPVLFLILVTVTNLVLLSLPLTNILHYEYSAVNGILQSFFGGILGIYYIRKNSLRKEVQFNVFSTNYSFLILFTVSQFLLAFISNAFLQICPISDGLLFYPVITIPSFLIGIILGIFAYSISQRFSYVLFIFLWFIVLLAPLGEIYANPQVYFYNPFIGFFPGTIYDEDIYVSWTLIFYRILNLIFFFAIFYSINSRKFYTIKNVRIIRVLLVIITVVSFSLLKPYLGFSTDVKRLINELNGKIETDHFVIVYPQELNESELNNLILSHEFAFNELSEKLEQPYKSKIFSFVFKDGAQKGKLFGANNADVAKPWLGQIYVNYTNYRSTLEHELAHIFSADYGVTIFKIAQNFNPVLIEGFATALADNYADNDIHYMAKLAYDSGYQISLESLFSGLNFFGQTSSISYIYAGSFMNYLAGKYGIDKFKKLYGDMDFKTIFNKDLPELENDYKNFLSKADFEVNKNTADLYFGRKPIFKRFCARFVANQISTGYELYKQSEFQKSEEIFSKVYDISDSYSALVGKSNSLVKMDMSSHALKFIQDEIQKFDGTSYFFNLEIVLGSLFIYNKQLEKADSIYTVLYENSPNEAYKDLAFFRRSLVEESDTSAVIYLKADPEIKLEIIKSLLTEYKNPALVSAYLNNSGGEVYNIRKEFLAGLGESIYSANSLFSISKIAFENNDFEYAIECIVNALKFNVTENKRFIYRQYLKKYNWCKNFGADVLSDLIN